MRVRQGFERRGQGCDDQSRGKDEQPAPVGDIDEQCGQEHAQDAAASGDAGSHTDRFAAQRRPKESG
ncbi:hypothetical protein [Nocardia sputi]|uniref:hypothetical protein n=1 Tax=Nocardia sputi TaxID=2943705 RepID=UPI0020BD5850|nr:hypothetical protein [Nocardia sputi]